MPNKKTLTLVLLTLIIAFGFFLRVYNIENAPPGIYPDEAVNGMDAIAANETGSYQWFYPANQGREGLFINIQALSFKIFGINVFALKFPSAIFGTLTILGTYFLAKELFSRRVGLLSSFLVASSFWAINFSRIGFRAIMLPMILAFTFYFLWRGLRTKKLSDFGIGGFIFGLGLHTYIAFRISPLILVVTLISLILSRENFLKNYWKHLLTFVMLAVFSAAPMIYTLFIAHPEYSGSRSSSISILSPEVNNGHLIQTFSRSFGLSLAKYNLWGDQNWRHNYPPYPILDPLSGIAFLFGFIYSLINFLRLSYLRLAKKIRNSQLDVYAFLVTWFFAMLVPEFMTAEGNPHALRAIGTVPVVFIFAGLTFNYFLKRADKKSYLIGKITTALVIAMFIVIGLFNPIKYLVFWANTPEAARAFEKNLMDVSDYLKTLPPQTEKFVIAESMQRIPIKVFNQDTANVAYIYPSEISQIQPKDLTNFIIISTGNFSEAFAKLKTNFPNLNPQEVRDSVGMSYYILK